MAKAPLYMPMPFGMTERPELSGASLSGIAGTFDRATAGLTPPPNTPPTGVGSGGVLYSPGTNQWFVGGRLFSGDNESEAVRSVQYMDDEPLQAPPAGDWMPVDRDSYLSFVERIRNPSMGRLASRNFGIGVDNLQLLSGYGAQFLGAQETGQSIVEQQLQDLGNTDVYNRNFTDIGSSPERGVLDWFVANVAQQGPNIVESTITAAIGAVAGGATGGGPNPVTAAGGALLALAGKQGFKQGIMTAARKYAQGKALSAGERKLLFEAAGITAAAEDAIRAGAVFGNQTARQFVKSNVDDAAAGLFKQAGRAGGAGLATGASNYAMGVADVYGESVEGGAPNRTQAALSGIPYAALETLPEFLLAGRVFGGIGQRTGSVFDETGVLNKAKEALSRFSTGAVAGGVAEGSTEVGQELLAMAANPTIDFDSPEGLSRLINAFAAGAALGGPIGGLANLAGRENPVDLINPLDGEVLGPEGSGPRTPAGPALPPADPVNLLGGPTASDGNDVSGVGFAQAQLGQDQFRLEDLARPESFGNIVPAPRLIEDGSVSGPAATDDALDGTPYTPALPDFTPPAFQPGSSVPQSIVNDTLAAQPEVQMPPAAQPGLVSEKSITAVQNGVAQDNVLPVDDVQQEQTLTPVIEGAETTTENTAGIRNENEAQPKVVRTYREYKNDPYSLLLSEVALPDGSTIRIARSEGAGGIKGWHDIDAMNAGSMHTYLADTRGEALRALAERFARDASTQETTQETQYPDTAAGRVQAAIDTVLEGKPSSDAWSDALMDVVSAAYFPSDIDTNLRKSGVVEKALEALNEVDSAGRAASANLAHTVAMLVRETATPRHVVRNGEVAPWYKYLASHDLIGKRDGVPYDKLAFPRDEATRRSLGLQVHYNAAQRAAQSEAETTQSTASPEAKKADPLATVMGAMAAVNAGKSEVDALMNRRAAGQAYTSYLAVGGDPNAKVFNYPVSSYFTKGGSEFALNVARRDDGSYRVQTTADEEYDPTGKLRAYASDGNFLRQNGEAASTSLGTGKIKLLLQPMLAKFAIKPKVHVFRNAADLKTKDPALFKKADAARPQGDFATTKAMGYAFGDTVIVFSDFIHSEKQLAFVLAHEVVGHIGLRAFMSADRVKKTLERVYNSDTRFKGVIERYMVTRGITKLEAVEEWLADHAARLETSVLARVWNTMKNAMNRIGLKFEDDAARAMVAQMRRYARSGDGSMVTADTLTDAMDALAASEHEGRFQTAPIDEGGIASKAATVRGMAWSMGDRFGTGAQGFAKFMESNDTKRWLRGKKLTMRDLAQAALQQVQTLDYKATKNAGLSELFELFTRQGQTVRTMLNKYNQLTAFTHSVNWGVSGRDAPSATDRKTAGVALSHIALHRADLTREADLDNYDNLFDAEGNFNEAAFQVLVDASEVTREQLAEGLEWTDPTTGQPARMEPIELTDAAWRIVQEQRSAINQAAVDLLQSKYAAVEFQRKQTQQRLAGMRNAQGRPLSDEQISDIVRISEKFREMYMSAFSVEGSSIMVEQDKLDEANTFLMETTRAFHEEEKLKDWLLNNPQEAASAFQGAEFDDIRASLQGLNSAGISERDVRRIQRVIQDQVVDEVETSNGERLAKRTILSAYVPFKREGKYQVRQIAVDAETNEVIDLGDGFSSATFYGRYDSRDKALQEALELDKLWNEYDGDNRVSEPTYKVKDADGSERTVKFVFETGDARMTQDRATLITYGELLATLERLSINLSPEARERLVTATTRQGATARSGLMRSANPGWTDNMVRSVSQHLEMNAHVSAKNVFRRHVDTVLEDDKLWFGDRKKLDALKKRYENEQDAGRKRRYQVEYEKYAYQFMESHRPVTGRDNTIEINGRKLDVKGRGETYREIGRSLVRWYSEDTNIIDATEDILNTTVGAQLKTLTVMSHLGMSVATAMINVASLATHTLSYLSFHNPNNGFGGGFGAAKSATEIFKATRDLSSFKVADAAFLKKIIDDGTFTKYGMTRDEAEFLHGETLAGNLAPALSDALLGSARGRQTDRMADFTRKWMSTFNYTEQLNRRATVMATYRLERDRNIAEGMTAEDARQAARDAADVALRTTQGEYSMFNRPEMFRGSVMQYIFMYKMFTLISVNLVSKLPYRGKMMFLGLLFLSSGLKGLPFADDIMDLIDTIAQMFNLPMTGIERVAYGIANDIAPGLAPWIMRGGLDQVTGGTMSTRLGMGDLVPLTGALKHGADPWREASDFAGPVFSVAAGLASWAGLIAKYGSEAIGIREDATTLSDILRQSPAAAIRAVGDTVAYMDDGAVTNSRGQVVSKDVGAATYLTRILGFYPAEATKQHDAIRTSKFAVEYAKAIKAEFTGAYVKAAISKDRKRMQQIVQDVADWNRSAKGTGLEVNKFMRSAQRAVREAQRPAVDRYIRTVPKALRPDTLQMMSLYGYSEEDF